MTKMLIPDDSEYDIETLATPKRPKGLIVTSMGSGAVGDVARGGA